jgi:hypothetical protein
MGFADHAETPRSLKKPLKEGLCAPDFLRPNLVQQSLCF